MANYLRAPRQWSLPDDESMNITKFENWKSNLLYTFSLNPSFTPFLVNGFSWSRKSNANPNRGLVDDDIAVPENQTFISYPKSRRPRINARSDRKLLYCDISSDYNQ